RLTGRAPGDCLGQLITALTADLARPADRFETVLAGRAPIRVEVRVRDLPEEPGQPSRTLWLLRDLRERTEIADALRVSEERFRDFAEISSDWLWELGADLRFTFISDRLRRSGGDPQRVLGTKPGEDAEGTPEWPAWQAHYAVLARRKPFRNFTTRRQFPDGS